MVVAAKGVPQKIKNKVYDIFFTPSPQKKKQSGRITPPFAKKMNHNKL